ncbi:hypothetical protein DS2_15469 [Catenovulum agarivorans DS-2]|uniref:Uncharacterized protein n=1 Tax=Catenovulum agarivorans DS-2 TaxID=1328313 RepID=W7QTP2_9ALTE|nr:hypothetical protein [Catenovulum agarivorans]EWH08800.1 hypothetical protein DS2_15469 [Catenovulum agarivorans DS-2]
MKYIFILFICLGLSQNSFAARNYIFSPTHVYFEYSGGYKVEIKTSQDGKSLDSLTVTLKSTIISIPSEDLKIVKNPVLNNVSVAGGTMGSGKDDVLQYVTLGYGAIYYLGDAVEEPIPDDLFENSKYLALPSKQDLGLGKKLAITFVAETLPDHLDKAYEIFSRKGAYAKFKAFLSSVDKLELWYEHEAQSLNQAIRDWCNSNSIKITSDS